MKTITIERGLDLPLKGQPRQTIRQGPSIQQVALVGDDYIGLKPTMLVEEGDRVKLGQPVFTDKKNPGFPFTSPGGGTVVSIHRGAKRKFESLVIALESEEQVSFDAAAATPVEEQEPEDVRKILQESGLWTSFRQRPYGKIAGVDGNPSSIFVTAVDTRPLAADPSVVLEERMDLFTAGLRVLRRMASVPIHLCISPDYTSLAAMEEEGVTVWGFSGPHPAGLPSTHIHFVDPVGASKRVWHVNYQDLVRIGHLFVHGCLSTETVVALSGEGVRQPTLIATRIGASLDQLCADELLAPNEYRLLSGSVLDGRPIGDSTSYLGRYATQVSTVKIDSGSALFGWMHPGKDRFSSTRLFLSALAPKARRFSFSTALWGGPRAIYPLPVYEKVMPMDIMPLPLLKSLSVRDTEKARLLGCLELVEEDLALCSYVCPGKNEFGPMLRAVLNDIELEG